MNAAVAASRILAVGEAAAAPDPVPAETVLELRGVGKGYGSGSGRTEVLKDVNLAVEEGEFVAIVGFSGSGKTTLISLLAGLTAPDSGTLLKQGRPIHGPGPDRGVVFQNYSLMPWGTVTDNVALAVNSVFASAPAAERAARTARYVDMVGLGPARDKLPAQLSGGMRQRVAVARALAGNPDVLLLDEPLSALDALTRAMLQDEIVRIWGQDRKTVVLITNDVDEALIMADRIIPLDPGPGASLGPSFRVDLPRPRDRRALNNDPRFVALRRQITRYLVDAGHRRSAAGDNVVALPVLTPREVGGAQSGMARFFGPRPGIAKPVRAEAVHGSERYVEFTQLCKVYPTPKGPQKIVDNFELKIRKGEFVSVIGHSGCGKSTVLSMAAGLVPTTSGAIILDGREVSTAGPDRGVVFQAPSLVPWLTARQNVALGVDRVFPHASKSEHRDMVEYYLGRVGLAGAMDKRAGELSNGMKQRVGIARAFALSPKLLLLDEPFGMLDSLTRWDLQEVLMETWARSQVTAIMVTHDVDEAILLSDRVVMMTNGPAARVGEVLDVDLPRPRDRVALANDPTFLACRRAVLDFLFQAQHAEGA